jgi:hypothetical protein
MTFGRAGIRAESHVGVRRGEVHRHSPCAETSERVDCHVLPMQPESVLPSLLACAASLKYPELSASKLHGVSGVDIRSILSRSKVYKMVQRSVGL